MSLNKRIKEARLRMGYTQEQLGSMIGVAKTTVAGYEKNREPDAATIGLIIDALKVDANFLFQDEMKELDSGDFSVSEIKMIKKYRDLDEYGKDIVDSVLDKEHKRSTAPKETVTVFSIPYAYDLAASAGTGEYAMDIAHFENVGITQKPPKGANFLIRVSGNSMEPEYFDNDKVFVKRMDDVDDGEIGLFFLDGDVYIKEKNANGLRSLNPDYQIIPVNEYSSIKCYGKIIGKCDCDITEI